MSAMRYYAACNMESAKLDSEAVANMLAKTIDTAILAPTGSKKRFLVANLIKDERAKGFKNYQLLQRNTHKIGPLNNANSVSAKVYLAVQN